MEDQSTCNYLQQSSLPCVSAPYAYTADVAFCRTVSCGKLQAFCTWGPVLTAQSILQSVWRAQSLEVAALTADTREPIWDQQHAVQYREAAGHAQEDQGPGQEGS